jgi:hypothetical protein
VGEFTADARHGRAYPDHDRESLSASLLRFSSNCAAGNFEAFTSEESRSVQSNSDFARFAFFVCPNADARLHVGDLYPGENVSVNGCNFYGATGSFERVIEDKECLRPYLTRKPTCISVSPSISSLQLTTMQEAVAPRPVPDRR